MNEDIVSDIAEIIRLDFNDDYNDSFETAREILDYLKDKQLLLKEPKWIMSKGKRE